MADYSTHNTGSSGKGIFVALLVIGAFVVLLAVLGSGTVPVDSDGTVDPAAPVAPAAIETAPTAPAVVE